MIFPYASYEVSRSSTVPSGVVYRPEVVLCVYGNGRFKTIQALVDTGSDETILPYSLAMLLGIKLDKSAATLASGVGGHEVRLLPGVVELEISQAEESYRWRAIVAFLKTEDPDDEVALLGFAGFLEYFHATFDSESLVIRLSANGRMSAVTAP
jgi:hypothetical protein